MKEFFKRLFGQTKEKVKTTADKVDDWAEKKVDELEDKLDNLEDKGEAFMEKAKIWTGEKKDQIETSAKENIQKIKDSELYQKSEQKLDELSAGLKATAENAKDAASNLADKAVNKMEEISGKDLDGDGKIGNKEDSGISS